MIARLSQTDHYVDSVAFDDDVIEIELQPDITGGLKIYVHVNGETLFRIGKANMTKTHVKFSGLSADEIKKLLHLLTPTARSGLLDQ